MTLITSPTRCLDQSHRSWSGDRGFDECQLRDRAYRLEGVRRPANDNMAVGSAVDESVGIVIGGQVPDVPAIVARLFAAEGLPPERVPQNTEKAIALVRLWVERVWPTLPEVYAYQYEIHWEHEGTTYHAHLDYVFTDGSFRDLKSSEKRLPVNRADTDEQLTWYAWAMREAHGILPPTVGLDGLIYANPPEDVRSWHPDYGKPWYDVQLSKRGHVELDELARTVARRERVRQWLDATDLHLPNGRSVAYACNDCPISGSCPAWRGYVPAEVSTNVAA